jgi:hypothetical protein
MLMHGRETNVATNGKVEHNSLLLAIFWYEGDSGCDGISGALQRSGPARNTNFTGKRLIDAEERSQHFRAAGAYESGDADDFAAAD